MSSGADPFGWIGSTIDGKYAVEVVVGEGGFGVVYRAKHVTLGDTVAVKCLKVPIGFDGEARDQFRRTFLEEGRLLRQLSRATTGIVQALDAGDAISPAGPWTPYLILEWLEGESLEDRVSKKLTLGDLLVLLDPAVRALATAHQHGVAHRDIKPANLFLTTVAGRPLVKVLDFGIAKVISEDASLTAALRATGGTLSAFTPSYGAPEQFAKRYGATGPWTDVFALGLVMVELLTGEAALDGDDVSQLYVASTDPRVRPTPAAKGLALPFGVEAVFRAILAVDPRERPTDAGAMWHRLLAAASQAGVPVPGVQAALGVAPMSAREAIAATTYAVPPQEGLEARATTTNTPFVGTHPIADRAPLPIPPPPSRTPRRRAWWPVVLSVGVLAAGASAVAVISARNSPQSPLQSPQSPLEQIVVAPTLAQAAAIPASPVVGKEVTSKTMVRIAAASFMMGHDKEGKFERPRHEVRLTRGFYLDIEEVTVERYKACVAEGACTTPSIHGAGVNDAEVEKFGRYCTYGLPGRGRFPVNCIDQAQAAQACAFEKKRLPTEAEWELAASGGEGRAYPWGDDEPTCDHGSFGVAAGKRCGGAPKPVGSSPLGRAASGALDMAGNVWEWTSDGWDPNAYGKAARVDPKTTRGESGVLRGGSWDFSSTSAKTTYRLRFAADRGHVSTGARCVKDLDAI